MTSITFTDLSHDEVVHLSRAYDNMKKGKPVSDAEWNAAAPKQPQGIPASNDLGTPQVQPAQQTGIPAPALDRANEIDALGVPYNPQLHSDTKSKNDKGAWRMKRGADKAAFKAWAEKHSRGGQAPATPQAAPQPAPQPPMTSDQINQQYAAPPTPPAAPSIPVPQQPVEVPDYATWHQRFTQVWNSGKLDAATFEQMNAQAGVPDANAYVSNDQARGMSYAFMGQLAA